MVTASMQPARIRLDRMCWIQLPVFNLVSFFQRRRGSYRAKPTLMQSGRPGQVLAKGILSRSKPLCTNYWARFWQNAPCPLSGSHFQTRLWSSTDDPDHIVQNQPGSDSVLANCVRFGPNGSGLETNSVQESSGPLLANTSEPIWIRRELDLACLLGNMHKSLGTVMTWHKIIKDSKQRGFHSGRLILCGGGGGGGGLSFFLNYSEHERETPMKCCMSLVVLTYSTTVRIITIYKKQNKQKQRRGITHHDADNTGVSLL